MAAAWRSTALPRLGEGEEVEDKGRDDAREERGVAPSEERGRLPKECDRRSEVGEPARRRSS